MSKHRSIHGFYLTNFKVLNRIFLAIIGSYGIAVLTSLVFLALPMDDISAIYWGQIASIFVCALILVLVFSLRRLWLAWTVVIGIAGLLGLINYVAI